MIGVDRGAGRQTLLDAGATVVVNDLDELPLAPRRARHRHFTTCHFTA